nr:immunoglobulin light chain junction region [Macaca mulatta]
DYYCHSTDSSGIGLF